MHFVVMQKELTLTFESFLTKWMKNIVSYTKNER